MKSGPSEPPQDEKPVLPPLPATKTPVKYPDGLVIHPMVYAWLTNPPNEPDNLLFALRNRNN
jgi:hypothetical protein